MYSRQEVVFYLLTYMYFLFRALQAVICIETSFKLYTKI